MKRADQRETGFAIAKQCNEVKCQLKRQLNNDINLEYIWREAGHRPIAVPDVVKFVGSSRRYAENRFKTVVGRTIMEEIRRVKLERVCALLSETNLSIGEIAQQCDFARESHLAFIFRKHHGMTMSAYRAAARGKP